MTPSADCENPSKPMPACSPPAVTVGLLLVLGTPFCFAIDLMVAQWAKGGVFPKWLVKSANLSEFFAHGFGVIVIAMLIALLDSHRMRSLFAGSTAFFSGLVADLGKLIIYRARPRDFDFSGNVWTTFQEWWPVFRHKLEHLSSSFPSSHAATAAGMMFALATLYPRGTPVYGLLLALACLQRIVSSAHFPSDVAFGAGLGWCCAWLVTRFVLPVQWRIPLAERISNPARRESQR